MEESARVSSRERAIGRAILADPLLAEALAAFADADTRSLGGAVHYVMTLGLRDLGFVSFAKTWAAGPRLEAYRRRDEPEPMGLLIPFLPWERAERDGGKAKGA